jgi:hypothetical protein
MTVMSQKPAIFIWPACERGNLLRQNGVVKVLFTKGYAVVRRFIRSLLLHLPGVFGYNGFFALRIEELESP